MIKIIKTTLCVAILCTTFSCAKQTLEQSSITETPKKVEIAILKAYLAELIDVKVNEISYDEKSEQFSLLGIEQINREQLTESFDRSLKSGK